MVRALTDPESAVAGFCQARSADPVRAGLYARDPFFREACRTIQLQPDFDADATASAVRTRSLLIFKPDAFAAECVEAGIGFVKESGFEILAAEAFTFTPAIIRAMWFYQFNRATLERLILTDALHGFSPSIVLLVRGGTRESSAAAALAALKGSADPEKRAGSSLRALLGDHNSVLNKVHSPDDPASFVRDAWICLGRDGFRRWLGADSDLEAGPPIRLPAAERRPLDFSEAFAVVDRWLGDRDPPMRARLAESAERADLPVDVLQRLLTATRSDRDIFWSAIVAASYLIPLNRPGIPKLL